LELRLNCNASDTLAVASDRAALGAILHGLCKYAESERNYLRALRIYHHEYGARHQEIAVLLNNLAAVCHATGRPRRAEYYYLAALRMKGKLLGRSHPDLAVTMNNLALLFKSQGRIRAARALMEKALRILESTLGGWHPSTICVQQNLRGLAINAVALASDSVSRSCLPLTSHRERDRSEGKGKLESIMVRVITRD
jgi:tetratricopeptide (TPR) repeat protein